MQSPYGGGQYPGPPQQPSSGLSSLTIVLLVLGGMLVLGGGACAIGALFVFGAVASVPPAPVGTSVPVVPAPTAAPTEEEPEADDDPPPSKPKTPAASKPVGPPAPAASTKKGPRVVDFVCPPGKAPGGVVRAGCMCGSDILGTACGAGGFSDVEPTAKGCRFTCD